MTTQKPTEPNGQGNPMPLVVWAFIAFIPSLVAISTMQSKNATPEFVRWLVVLGVVCSLLSGFGLLRRVKDVGPRVIFSVMLGFFLFCLNVVIVAFVGCSKMGPM
jgi:hypothetical protein